jgi:hypothetical protein
MHYQTFLLSINYVSGSYEAVFHFLLAACLVAEAARSFTASAGYGRELLAAPY